MITINASDITDIIIDVEICHFGLPASIVTNRGSLFTSKFWSSLFYFFSIKRWLSTAFHSQIDGQTKRQNWAMKSYLKAFVNFK